MDLKEEAKKLAWFRESWEAIHQALTEAYRTGHKSGYNQGLEDAAQKAESLPNSADTHNIVYFIAEEIRKLKGEDQ